MFSYNVYACKHNKMVALGRVNTWESKLHAHSSAVLIGMTLHAWYSDIFAFMGTLVCEFSCKTWDVGTLHCVLGVRKHSEGRQRII